MEGLRSRRRWLLTRSLAPNTWRTYQAAWNSYRTFVLEMGWQFFPLSPNALEYYVVSMARRLRHDTIKVYLSALKFYNNFYGFDSSHCFSAQLRYILRGVRRTQASSLLPRPRRIPISPAHLRLLHLFVDAAFPTQDALCYRAAFNLAFSGMLRVSEFTCPRSHVFDHTVHLSRQDIAFSTSPALVHIRIKQSKTDPFREGCIIRVARTGNAICPFDALLAYLRADRRHSGPLFALSDGSFLTRAHIHEVLRLTFPFARPGPIGTHSFRIGGATMLCCLGVPDATIQILGRWSSCAFRRYLHVSDQFLVNIHFRAARHSSSFSRVWQLDVARSAPVRSPR